MDDEPDPRARCTLCGCSCVSKRAAEAETSKQAASPLESDIADDKESLATDRARRKLNELHPKAIDFLQPEFSLRRNREHRITVSVIAQTRSDDTDQFALGVFVDAGKGTPVIAQATQRGKLQTKFGSVFCGDVVLAVRWLIRDESDAEGRTFYEPSDEDEAGSVIPVNSTELRHAGFGLTVLEPSIRTACNAEWESDVEDGGDANGEDEWEDDDGESGGEVIDDRIEEDSAYVHGRRLVLSVADEQTALDRCW